MDNVLTVSAKMPAEMAKTLTEAAKKAKDVFGAPQMADFDMKNLDFTLELMKRAGLDPMTYSW